MSDNVTGARSASLSQSKRHLNNLIESTQNVTFYNELEKEKQYLTSSVAFKKAKDELLKKIGLSEKGSDEKNKLEKELEEVCSMLDEFLGDYPVYITLEQLNEFGWTHIPIIPEYDLEKSKPINSLRKMNKCDIHEINGMLHKYGITKPTSIAHFFSQSYSETMSGSFFIEGSNDSDPIGTYSKEKYGYKYRGAGCIQLTHDYNYEDYSKYIGDERIYTEGALYVAQNYGWDAGGWFWRYRKNLSLYCDSSDGATVEYVTKAVVGQGVSNNVIAVRQGHYDRMKGILGF